MGERRAIENSKEESRQKRNKIDKVWQKKL